MSEKKISFRYKISAKKNTKSRLTNLSLILKLRKMSQRDLAKKSDLEYYQISKIVNGLSPNIYLTTAKKICNVLDCSLDEAFEDIY